MFELIPSHLWCNNLIWISADYPLRQHSHLTRWFAEVMRGYHKAQVSFREKCKAQIQRQLEIGESTKSNQNINTCSSQHSAQCGINWLHIMRQDLIVPVQFLYFRNSGANSFVSFCQNSCVGVYIPITLHTAREVFCFYFLFHVTLK